MGDNEINMKPPLVSIIIPIYRVESFLPKCIDSVLSQTYSNIEVICVDDGSDDKSGAICDEYAKRDSRVRVIHKDNEGVGMARYVGAKYLKGDYASFVDPDDYLTSDAIEVMLNTIVEFHVDLVVAQHFNDKSGYITPFHSSALAGFYDRVAIDKMLKTNFLYDEGPGQDAICLTLWGKLFKKECLESGLKEGIGYLLSQDTISLYAIIKNIQSLYVVDNYIYYYVFHSSQATKRPKDMWWKLHLQAWKKVYSLDVEGFLDNQLPAKLLQDYCSASLSFAKEECYSQFRSFAIAARKDIFVKEKLWNNFDIKASGMTSKTVLFLMRWHSFFAIWLIGHYQLIDRIVLLTKKIKKTRRIKMMCFC